MKNYFNPVKFDWSFIARGTNLWCNLKGDLVGGTRADTVSRWTPLLSLFGSEAEFNLGCCCLKTSTLGPRREIQIKNPPTHTHTVT